MKKRFAVALVAVSLLLPSCGKTIVSVVAPKCDHKHGHKHPHAAADTLLYPFPIVKSPPLPFGEPRPTVGDKDTGE